MLPIPAYNRFNMDTVVDSIVEQLTGKLNECIQSLQGLKEIIGIMKQVRLKV